MLTKESSKVWVSVALYLVSAIALYIAMTDTTGTWHRTLPVLANTFALVGIWLSMPRHGRLNTSVARIFEGFRSGDNMPTTVSQKICATLGCLLVIASTVACITL